MVLVQVACHVGVAERTGLESGCSAVIPEQKISNRIAGSAQPRRSSATIVVVEEQVMRVGITAQEIRWKVSLLHEPPEVKPKPERMLAAVHRHRVCIFPSSAIARSRVIVRAAEGSEWGWEGEGWESTSVARQIREDSSYAQR